MKKAILVTNIPNPYRIPLFNELAEKLRNEDCLLKVVFGAQSYSRRKFKLDMDNVRFDYEFLEGHVDDASENVRFSYSGLSSLLRREKPDVVVVPGFSIATMKALAYRLISGTPYIIWSGSIHGRKSREKPLRQLQRRLLARYASAFVSYSSKAKSYLSDLGAEASRIYVAINTVDTTFFSQRTREERLKLNGSVRRKKLTYVGYLIPRKGVDRILSIIEKLSRQRQDFEVDIIGDGEERSALEEYIRERGMDQLVHFHGFRQKDEIPSFLAISNVFLFQTNFDVWGLVLNEAMSAGVPCISSVNAGATHDLIRDGENGFVVDYQNEEEVINRINWILDHPDDAARMGEKGSRFIAEHATIGRSAEGFINAINAV